MLRTQTDALATNFKIPLEDLKWYAAFHNESHHPHVHLMVYTSGTHKPYLSKQGVMNLRSSLARDIFKHDLHEIYVRQTEHRDELRNDSSRLVAQIVEQINNGVYDNPNVEKMLRELADRLYRTNGKKQYGYLRFDVKALVNRIVTELAADERISAMWRHYRQAKELLDVESDVYDPHKAVELLIESADLDNTVAKYLLGKLFLRGEHIPKNVDYALRWLEEAVEDGNPYAEYLLGKTLLKGEDIEQNTDRAEELLRRSISQGNRYAAYTLGKALLDGNILPQNIPEAMRLLKMSADKNFPQAQYVFGKLLYRGEVTEQDIPKALEYLENASAQKNPYAAYLAGKIRLTEEAQRDIAKAIRHFEIAAEGGNDYAEYQLGKIYLYGREIDRDYDKAIAYLTSAAEHGNQYAEQLLHSVKTNRNWSAALGSLRILQHLSRMIQNRMDDERKERSGSIDRKLKRKIDEKKQAHGLKQ